MTNRFTCAPIPALRGLRLSLVVLLAASAPAAFGQVDDDPDGPATVSRPVVQSIAPSPSRELNAALARLAADPRNVLALHDAADAALRLGDSDAAIGFLTRANEVQPGNPRSRMLIGKAYLLAENPVDAVRAFDEAERAGADTFAMAADRALAYDLVGDNGRAQRWYQVALSKGSDDEITRRYALSLAISGDRRGAEALIAPLIQRQDRPTWRTRTFVMAVTGGPDEAVAVAYASMPQDLAASIAPYLRYMPRLTPAQQASAANFGRFPRAAEIGRDDPRIVQYAAANPRAPRLAEAGLIPSGTALGPSAGASKPSREKRRRPDREERQLASAAQAKPGRVQATSITAAPQAPGTTILPARPAPAASVAAIAALPVQSARAPEQTAKSTVLSVLDLPPGASRPAPASIRPTPAAVATPTATSVQQPAPQPQLQPHTRPVQLAAAAPTQVAAPGTPQGPSTPVAPAAVARSQASGFDLSKVGASTGMTSAQVETPAPPVPQPVQVAAATSALVPAPLPVSASAPASRIPESTEAPSRPADFASLFKTFAPPAEERRASIAAVDITRIAPKTPAKPARADPRGERPDAPTDVSRTSAKEMEKPAAKNAKPGAKDSKLTAKDATKVAQDAKVAKDAKAKKSVPSHPSRIWVQVLTGANKDMMDNEWRRLVKEAPETLKVRKPYISPWRSNFRLLTGPFESEAAAQEFITKLRKGGVSSYQWTSPAGQAVDTLALK